VGVSGRRRRLGGADPRGALVCQDGELRQAEIRLLRYLYQAEHFHDDFVFEPCLYFDIPGTYTGYLYGNVDQKTAWGIDIVKPRVGQTAYHLDAFIKDEGGFEPLMSHEVDFIEDTGALKRLKEKYEDALDGILEIKFQLPYSVLVQSHLIELVHLRGLENLLYDLYDIPDLLMDVIGHMARSKARLLTRLEREHRLFENRVNIYTGSGGLGYTTAPRKQDGDILLGDMWGFADAQEFGNVSAEMFERFALKNQKIALNLFGMGCYGCCEPWMTSTTRCSGTSQTFAAFRSAPGPTSNWRRRKTATAPSFLEAQSGADHHRV
jgi:hypothetical protein